MSDGSSPPVGYRPAIPVQVKFSAVMRLEGKCCKCGNKLGDWTETQFDHRPPLQMRGWDPVAGDTLPAANDPDYIDAIHKDCHKAITTGRRGDSKLSKRGGDISEIAKLRRIEKKQAEFRRKLLTKETDDPDSVVERPAKKAWPSRPFPKRPKGKPK